MFPSGKCHSKHKEIPLMPSRMAIIKKADENKDGKKLVSSYTACGNIKWCIVNGICGDGGDNDNSDDDVFFLLGSNLFISVLNLFCKFWQLYGYFYSN